MLNSYKNFKFNFKRLSISYNLVKVTEAKLESTKSLLDSINHLLELYDAHHITSEGNIIYFKNNFLERGFKPTLMGVFSSGSLRIENSKIDSTIYYKCDYTMLYDIAFLLFGVVLSILFNPSFEVWCFGGILGFIIRYIIVFTKSNEFINQVIESVIPDMSLPR